MNAKRSLAEYKELLDTIKDLRDILAKEQRVFTIIKKELREIRDKYATPRLTATRCRTKVKSRWRI